MGVEVSDKNPDFKCSPILIEPDVINLVETHHPVRSRKRKRSAVDLANSVETQIDLTGDHDVARPSSITSGPVRKAHVDIPEREDDPSGRLARSRPLSVPDKHAQATDLGGASSTKPNLNQNNPPKLHVLN